MRLESLHFMMTEEVTKIKEEDKPIELNENDLKKLEKVAEEGEEENEEKGSSLMSNLLYLITSFLFIIIFVTELDLTS